MGQVTRTDFSTYKVAVLLRRHPDVTVAPLAEFAQFLHFAVAVLDVVFYGQAVGIEDADVAPEPEEDPACFVGEETREGTVGGFVSLYGYIGTSFWALELFRPFDRKDNNEP